MTGGSERAATINKELAQIAKACNIPMAVGSTHSALKDPNAESSFTVVRDENPEGLIFSNVGADIEYAKAKKSIELLNADALQIHVNAASTTDIYILNANIFNFLNRFSTHTETNFFDDHWYINIILNFLNVR